MPLTPESFIVDPQGAAVQIAVTDVDGNPIDAYANENDSDPMDTPIVASEPIQLFFTLPTKPYQRPASQPALSGGISATTYVVSVKVNGVEVAGPDGSTAYVDARNMTLQTLTVDVGDGAGEVAALAGAVRVFDDVQGGPLETDDDTTIAIVECPPFQPGQGIMLFGSCDINAGPDAVYISVIVYRGELNDGIVVAQAHQNPFTDPENESFNHITAHIVGVDRNPVAGEVYTAQVNRLTADAQMASSDGDFDACVLAAMVVPGTGIVPPPGD